MIVGAGGGAYRGGEAIYRGAGAGIEPPTEGACGDQRVGSRGDGEAAHFALLARWVHEPIGTDGALQDDPGPSPLHGTQEAAVEPAAGLAVTETGQLG